MSLELRGVTKRFGSVTAVNNVDLTVGSGQTLALLGPSGCGKSTLLRLVAGLERCDAGQVTLQGTDMTSVPPQRRHMGMVFQSFALFPHLNVAQNVAFGLVEAGVRQEARNARVNAMLQLVGLGGLEARRVEQLSGGQQQRVALARALAPDPDTLLLDEPLSNLDEQLRQSLKDELGMLLGTLGKRAIYVTHDQTEAFTLADQVALMRAGRIVQLGTSAELLESPVSGWAARFLGHENVYAADTSAAVPVPANGRETLFRADLARLLPLERSADAEADGGAEVPAGWSRAEAEVTQAAREGLTWRLALRVPDWNVMVIWRGFERDVPEPAAQLRPQPQSAEPASGASVGLSASPVGHAPRPGLRVLLAAPANAWRALPGERQPEAPATRPSRQGAGY